MSETGERVFLDSGGVRVTKARFQVGSQTWAMAAVSAVSYLQQAPSLFVPIFLLIIGAPALLLGLAIFSGPVKWVAALVTAFGAFLVVGAIVVIRQGRPTYVVSLATTGGQVQALSSPDRVQIESVVRALNDALVARG